MKAFGMELTLTDLAKACGVSVPSACQALKKMNADDYCIRHGIEDFYQLRDRLEEIKNGASTAKAAAEITKIITGGETVSLKECIDEGVDTLVSVPAEAPVHERRDGESVKDAMQREMKEQTPDINQKMWAADDAMRKDAPSREKVLMIAMNRTADALEELIHFHGAEIPDGLGELADQIREAIDYERWRLLKDHDLIDWHTVAEQME